MYKRQTLEALAYNLYGIDCVVAPVLDARCSQVYTALFRWEGERITRLEDVYKRQVNVQMMVFGNTGDTSGTGVAFTLSLIHISR